MMTDFLDALRTPIQRHVPLGPWTWYGVGGPAEAVAEPRDVDELSELMRACAEHAVPVRVLGKGANLLVADEGVSGVVVRLTASAFRQIDIEGCRVTAGGGADLERLITATVRAARAGLEGLGGIPASVGGAVRMNAGGRFGEIGPLVESVQCMTRHGELVIHDRTALEFSYRRSNVPEPIILEAAFTLTPGDGDSLRRRLKEVFACKKKAQPLAARSAGCAFKNPPPDMTDRTAGQLIDEAGLKGYRLGTAQVSPRHANFIVLDAEARADDAIRLIKRVRQRVAEHCGIALEREVVLWPGDEA